MGRSRTSVVWLAPRMPRSLRIPTNWSGPRCRNQLFVFETRARVEGLEFPATPCASPGFQGSAVDPPRCAGESVPR